MKRFAILASLFGLFLISLLVGYSGAGEVFQAVASAGWATLLVVLARAFALAGDGLAWRFLFPQRSRPRVAVALAIRFIREGVNQLLPVAQVGGDLIGARLLTFWGGEGALAGASVVVDLAIQASSQFVFALVGLGILLALNGDSTLLRYAALGMLVAALGIGGFFLVQRREGPRIIGAMLRRLAGGREWLSLGAVERLYDRLGTIYANRRGVAACAALHMLMWFVGAFEVWVALRFMGHPITVPEAIVIESLGQAVRGAAFAVPGALGVQEGGFIALCALFGVPAGPALALSLVKRVPDLVIGLPGLLAWQSIEGKRLLGRSPRAAIPGHGDPAPSCTGGR